MRYQSVVYVDVGEYYYQVQEYVAWCHSDADRNERDPLRTFDVPVDKVGMLHPVIADGEIIDPEVTLE